MPEASKGPWKMGGRGDCEFIFDADGKSIAKVIGANAGGRYPKGREGDMRDRHVQAMKNKRLMASAPEMIDALKRCVSALQANGAPNCEAAKEARAAIQKAGFKP